MSNIVLHKDSPKILYDFGKTLTNGLKVNLTARRIRWRYNSIFKNGGFVASKVKPHISRPKAYKASGELSRSIEYRVVGTTLSIAFNEYGVMLDRGANGYKIRQFDSDSLLADADIEYDSLNGMRSKRLIHNWIKARGLKPRLRDGSILGKKLPNTPKNRKAMEYLITRSLLNRGMNSTFWFTSSYLAHSKKLPADLIFGTYKTIDDSFDNIFKK